MTQRWKCNACGSVYPDTQPDGMAYFHVCADVLTPGAQPDPSKPGFTQPTSAPQPNKRNENIRPGLVYSGGIAGVMVPDPNEATRQVFTPVDSVIISEGAGRTAVNG